MAQPAAASFEISSSYVGGFGRALRQLGLVTEPLLKQLGDDRAMFDTPHARPWWDGKTFERVSLTVMRTVGPAQFEELSRVVTTNSINPIVKPLLSVVSALFGLRPETVFSRMADFSSAAVRGVTVTWQQSTPSTGALTIRYPEPVDMAMVEASWRGACRSALETANADGAVDSVRVEGLVLVLSLSWKPKER